jgi:hypothetical protein
MAKIGKVVISPGKPIGTVSVRGSNLTTIANPKIKSIAQVTTNDILDFNTTNVENGYTFVYNSTTQKYETSPINLADVNVISIFGGTF